jgi:hypothetical protein
MTAQFLKILNSMVYKKTDFLSMSCIQLSSCNLLWVNYPRTLLPLFSPFPYLFCKTSSFWWTHEKMSKEVEQSANSTEMTVSIPIKANKIASQLWGSENFLPVFREVGRTAYP